MVDQNNFTDKCSLHIFVQPKTPPIKTNGDVSPKTTKSISSLSVSFLRTPRFRKNVNDRSTKSSTTLNDGNESKFLQVPFEKTLERQSNIISSKSEEFLSRSNTPSNHTHRSVADKILHMFHFSSSEDLSKKEKPTSKVNKRSGPRWQAVRKVVTSLLTFTRTKKERYQWIQLVGHPGTFQEGLHEGFILKQLSQNEQSCFEYLQRDILKDFVPKYNGIVQDGNDKFFIEIEDLLSTFTDPCIMDCKIGVRTYLEEDLEKSELSPKPREDLYEKMIAIDFNAPTDEEHAQKKVLKPRYMVWRETLSSSQDLGFRIEAIKKSGGLMSKEFQTIKQRSDVKQQLREFLGDSLPRARQYLDRLLVFHSQCRRSNFLQQHEIIGSSLLFVHDANKAAFWMIDFGKTRPLQNGSEITHYKPWTRGSHEDGYLFGVDNLILLFNEIVYEYTSAYIDNEKKQIIGKDDAIKNDYHKSNGHLS